MNRETRLGKKFISKLKEFANKFHYHRHEDMAAGVPDMSYTINGISGWVELKQFEKWPKRVSTKISIPHFTPFQKVWLTKRSRSGCLVFVLLETPDSEYWLFDYPGYLKIGQLDRKLLKNEAICVTTNLIQIMKHLIKKEIKE